MNNGRWKKRAALALALGGGVGNVDFVWSQEEGGWTSRAK